MILHRNEVKTFDWWLFVSSGRRGALVVRSKHKTSAGVLAQYCNVLAYRDISTSTRTWYVYPTVGGTCSTLMFYFLCRYWNLFLNCNTGIMVMQRELHNDDLECKMHGICACSRKFRSLSLARPFRLHGYVSHLFLWSVTRLEKCIFSRWSVHQTEKWSAAHTQSLLKSVLKL